MADPDVTPAGPERHVEKRLVTIDASPLTTPTNTRLVVLRIYHATGLTVIPLMPDYAKAVARELEEAAGGIVTATDLPPTLNNGRKH